MYEDIREVSASNILRQKKMADLLNRESPLFDAFNRLRISDPETLFDTTFQYDTLEGITWHRRQSGTATLAHLIGESAISMGVGSIEGDALTYQSKQYIRYQPGKSQLIFMTGVFGQPREGCRKRWGYYDDFNGIFWEQHGNQANIVRRSSITGTDESVPQQEWNVDKLDGTGESRLDLDHTKAQILIIDLEWLSVGRVRVGFIINGLIVWAHHFSHANIISTGYMGTANLPVRYQIFNTANTTGNTSMRAICSSVMSEGGFREALYFPTSAGNGITEQAVTTTRRPVLSIRPKLSFKGQENRSQLIPLGTKVRTRDSSVFVEVVHNGEISGGSWVSVDDDSTVEINRAPTGITGGRVVESYYAVSGLGAASGAVGADVTTLLPVTIDIPGTDQDTFSVVCTAFTGTAQVSSVLDWRELW